PQSCAVVQADLLDLARVEALVDDAAHAFGRLDAVVNNASSFYPTPFGAIGPGEGGDLLRTNLRAPLVLAQSAARRPPPARGAPGNLVDIHADRPLRDFIVYSVATSGRAGLTRALALELGPEVRVNGVAPGAILWPDGDAHFAPSERNRIVDQTPLARIGSPD